MAANVLSSPFGRRWSSAKIGRVVPEVPQTADRRSVLLVRGCSCWGGVTRVPQWDGRRWSWSRRLGVRGFCSFWWHWSSQVFEICITFSSDLSLCLEVVSDKQTNNCKPFWQFYIRFIGQMLFKQYLDNEFGMRAFIMKIQRKLATFICSRRNRGEELLLYRSISDLSSLALLMLFKYFSALLSRYGVLDFVYLDDWCSYVIKMVRPIHDAYQQDGIFLYSKKAIYLLEDGRPLEVGVS